MRERGQKKNVIIWGENQRMRIREQKKNRIIQYGNLIGLSKCWRIINNMRVKQIHHRRAVLVPIKGRKTRITHNVNDVISITTNIYTDGVCLSANVKQLTLNILAKENNKREEER